MSKILEMRQKRAELWDKAKAFLDEHQNENGVMSAEDTEEYERMEQDVVDMGHAIERMERAEQMDREMNDPANPVLAGRPERPAPAVDNKRGTASDAYKKAFWNSVRGRMNYDVRNALQVGELTEGGYTVPDEFENQLIEALQDENIMRGLVHVISTSSGDRKIPLVTNYGTASWIEEEAQIPESDVAFNQITLGAHKLATAIRISQELLNDSAFDLASFIAHEFQRRAGAAEEEAILSGDGSHKPIGLLHDTLGAQVGVTTASATAITADELIDLQHSLKSGYRRKAAFIMNDAAIKAIRKLKDGQGQYLWQPSIREGVPDMILNTRVYMSNYMPLVEAGNKVILYGDYSYYWLADRTGRTLQRLNELYAMTDQVGFKLTERLDGRLILPEAVKVLKMKAA
ncbi:MAG: phage major capsid protein [Oscillospiraceae bacterium]|nr:phage major capsid protein [Oscillospiraceae bacterium]